MDQLVIFISYSRFDGTDVAVSLRDWLRQRSPPIEPWIDLDRRPGYSFSSDIEDAIGGCDVLLFVMTHDSVRSEWCRRELSRATRTAVRILPLRVHDEELPLELEGLSSVDFSEERRRQGWKELGKALISIASPEGRRETLDKRQDLLKREARRATGSRRERYESGLIDVTTRIREEERRRLREEERRRLGRPNRNRQQLTKAINRTPAQERKNEAAPVEYSGIRSVNGLPPVLSNQFRDRALEIQRLEEFLSDPSIRLVAVIGGDGIGKTAMVSRLYDNLQRDPRRLPVDAFVYLPVYGTRLIRSATLLEALCKVIPDDTAAAELTALLNDSALALPEKLDEVLKGLGDSRVIVVIDDAEDLLDKEQQLRDIELDEMVRTLLRRRHGVKIVLVTREAPDPILHEFAETTGRVPLDAGLPRADAYEFLRRLDSRDTLGLRSASERHLERARRLTRGSPRGLEAIYCILESEPDTSLPELLLDMDQLPADQDMVGYLIGRMFDDLDTVDRRVMQALAVYGRPVLPEAVDYLLQEYIDGFDDDSEPTLDRLLARRLIRQDGDRFYLPPSPDGERLLRRIPRGLASDRDRDPPPLTQLALLHRAAGYFAADEAPIERIDDLAAKFAEIELRMRGEDYKTAWRLISSIDKDYLRGWGYSEAVASWREQLIGKLDGPAYELHNLAWLAGARQQQDEYRQAIEYFGRAHELAKQLRDTANEFDLLIDVATAYFESGQPTKAAEKYKEVLRAARRRPAWLEEARALAGLALCEGETGRYRQALEHHATALGIVKDRQDKESRLLKAELYLSAGWFYGQIGETEEALEWIREGREIACELDDELLRGFFLGGEAMVLLDDVDVPQAIELATEAVKIGVRTRNRHLSREGNTTLAFAYLCFADLDAARGAADAAARYRRSRRALGAYVLQGITLFRQGQRGEAREAFRDAHLQAVDLLRREDRNFEVLDAEGLALCGLALCGDREQLHAAVDTYRAAREVTRERGAVRRSRRLLRELGRGHEAELAEAFRAVGGQ